jgi:hypothetical protein
LKVPVLRIKRNRHLFLRVMYKNETANRAINASL